MEYIPLYIMETGFNHHTFGTLQAQEKDSLGYPFNGKPFTRVTRVCLITKDFHDWWWDCTFSFHVKVLPKYVLNFALYPSFNWSFFMQAYFFKSSCHTSVFMSLRACSLIFQKWGWIREVVWNFTDVINDKKNSFVG